MERMLRRPSVALAGLGSLVLVVLIAAGCTPVPSPDETGTGASPSPTPSASASEAPEAELAGCDTVLTQAGNDDLASSNLSLVEYRYEMDWDYPLLEDMATDGLVCKWGGSGDVLVVVGQLAMDEQEWESTRTELEATGYVPDDSHGIPGFINGHDGTSGSYLNRGFAWRDGILYYASYPGILEFVPAFQQ
jgi:hypothetical protein